MNGSQTEPRVPYSEDEAQEAWLFVGRYGPANAWTATNGTAARMIGRLLEERERAIIAARENIIQPEPGGG
jgi:hypothetical protein